MFFQLTNIQQVCFVYNSEETIITDRPQNISVESYRSSAQFDCAAKTDKSTPLTISWYRVMGDENQDIVVYNTAQVTVTTNGAKLSFHLSGNTSEQWAKYRGKYRCHATNGYSEDNVEVLLTVDDPCSTDVVLSIYRCSDSRPR